MTKLNRGELTRRQAEREILAILDRVPDSQLSKPDSIEERDGNTWAWYGGHGYGLRVKTGADGAQRRRWDLIEVFQHEWLRRERQRRFGVGWEFYDGTQINPKVAS